VFHHAGYFVGLAALDPQTGLVVSIRFIGIGGCERDDHAGTVSWDSKLIKPSVQIDRIPQRGTAGRQGVYADALSKITSE
jgi:hypothetical protein